VALHEATKGISFEAIIESEYDSLSPPEAKVLYLDICALHQFGPPVRAGLISRVHGIGFNEFQGRFFKPLENVVTLDRRGPGGDYVYHSRHNYIAEVVFKRGLKTREERYETLVRILEKLNPDYSYDRSVLVQLIKAKSLVEMFPERTLGNSIYQVAERSVGRTPVILHQNALYEMRLSSDRAGLERAEALVREALLGDPRSPAINHTLAELAFRRSNISRSPEEASVERTQAAAIARKLTRDAPRSYAHHTIAKVAIADLQAAMEADNKNSTELSVEAVNKAMQEAESAIRTGLAQFPNDEYMLTAEAELSNLLRNADRALRALSKAFERNPASELVANRLFEIYLSRKERVEAQDVLKRALAANPGRPLLNIQYAKVLSLVDPGVEAEAPETILFYLDRANAKASESPALAYKYARLLFLAGRAEESRSAFGKLARMRVHTLNKPGTGRVLNSDNSSRRYNGQVAYLEDDFGLIDIVQPKGRIYFRRMGPLFAKGALVNGDRVTFYLEFNSRGPIATHVAKAT
jgi:tetratricopeptide (TPR) repeat protein